MASSQIGKDAPVHGSIPHHERESTRLRLVLSVRPEVYPPSAAPEATRVSKGERKY